MNGVLRTSGRVRLVKVLRIMISWQFRGIPHSENTDVHESSHMGYLQVVVTSSSRFHALWGLVPLAGIGQLPDCLQHCSVR